jgi:hypothetical protein
MKSNLEIMSLWQREYERVLVKIQELINKEKQKQKGGKHEHQSHSKNKSREIG